MTPFKLVILSMFVSSYAISYDWQHIDFNWQECYLRPEADTANLEYAYSGNKPFTKPRGAPDNAREWGMTQKEFYWMGTIYTNEDKIKRFKEFWDMDKINKRAINESFDAGELSKGVISGRWEETANVKAKAVPPFTIRSQQLMHASFGQLVACYGMRFEGKDILDMNENFYAEYSVWLRDNWNCLNEQRGQRQCAHLEEVKSDDDLEYDDALGFHEEEETEEEKLARRQENERNRKHKPCHTPPMK